MSLPLSCWQVSGTEKDSLSGFEQKSYLVPDKSSPTNIQLTFINAQQLQ